MPIEMVPKTRAQIARQAEEVPDDNTYLVCPLNDDEVEAVRAGAYKFRQENFPQEAEESSNDLSLEL